MHCLLEVCSFGILLEQLRAGFLIPSSQVGDRGFELFLCFTCCSVLRVPGKELLLKLFIESGGISNFRLLICDCLFKFTCCLC